MLDWKFIAVGLSEADRNEFSLSTDYKLTCISLGSDAIVLFSFV